ncbi:MAG TPA: GAF domain-containing protein [Candidatus Sulfomarinibacteraceae bacterium]|nr:GAF domain-containing protein [Candidatus Sulfomarinibacteraceae bacterium]
MNERSLRSQLGAIFLGFLLLVLGSVAATSWLVQTQRNDAAVINLAGRQRMLAQQMTRLALTEPASPQLAETIALFQQTQTVLVDGGETITGSDRAVRLPPTTDPTIRAELDEVAAAWAAFQTQLQPAVDGEHLQAEFPALLANLDDVVSAYEAQAQARVTRLRWVQLAFLAAAFLLLAWGYRLIRRTLIQPLTALEAAAQKIGAGHLNEPLPALPTNELGHLGQSMEAMRREIAAHQGALKGRVAQRVQELTAVLEFTQEIVRQLEPDQLLQAAVRHTRALIQADAASVCVLDAGGRSLQLAAGSGAKKNLVGLRQSVDRSLAAPVLREHKAVVTEGGCTNCGFLRQFPGASCIAAPLQVGGRSLGALCVVREQRPFDADEARALTLLANAAAIGLQNARLIASGKQQAEENAALAERERLAAELHDSLAQTLGAMHLSVDQLAHNLTAGENETAQSRLATVQTHLKQAYAQVRLALTGLREAPPDEGEFMAEVLSLVAEFEAQSDVSVRVEADDLEAIGLTAVTQKQALHIVREALTNIRRHARASQVRLAITRDNGALTLLIADDGCGFDPAQVNSRDHLGLTIMRARAERSQGRLDIRAAPGEGTQIQATFPVQTEPTQTPEAA